MDVDVVILSIPLNRIPGVAPLFTDVPAETVVIDTSNYYPARDERIEAIEGGQVESLWVTEQLGRLGRQGVECDRVGLVRARKDKPAGDPDRIAIPVAADSDTERRVGMTLVEDTGFDAVDAGSLAESWRQQPGTPVYCTDLKRAQVPAALASADAARSPRRRDLAAAAIAERFGHTINPDAEYGVRLNRVLFM